MGPWILWPEMATRSGPSGIGSRPKPWTASHSISAPACVRHPRQLGDRLDHADLIVDQHHRDHGGLVVDHRLGHVEIDQAVGADLKADDLDALAFEPFGGVEHRGMLGRDGDQLAALGCLERALERPVQRLGRAAR